MPAQGTTVVSQAVLPAIVIDLGGYQLERHVRRAFQEAWQRAGGGPLSAGHLLQAAIHIGGSEAFATIARLLPVADPSPPASTKLAPPNLNAIVFGRPLADAFSVAEGFLAANKRAVWGRDYVTLALLADDPSLDELAGLAGTSVGEVRASWREFVRASGLHRSPEEWDRWWNAAGALPPGTTDDAGAAPDAYLLTWNPSRFPESEMAERVEARGDDGSVTFGWSSGNNRSMKVGDRVYLVRQGEPSRRGLVGVGTVAAAPEERPHWDRQRRAGGDTSLIVEVRWEAIATTPMVELSSLVTLTGDSKLWASRAGGVGVDPAVRDRLEGIWRAAWERHTHGLAPALVAGLEPRRLIARFDPDVGRAPDSLNIDRYVDAFARIAASRSLVPPLSVGLFGDWGSGKTFFMDRLHEEIAALARGGPDRDDLYVRDICQIRFNAWHYAETDLWASLVSTVFKELRRYLDGPAEDADEFNKLLNELEIATELREEAQRRLDDATTQLDEAEQAVAAAERALQELPPAPRPSEEELRRIMGESVAQVAGTTREELSTLLQEAFAFTGDERFRDLDAPAGGGPTVSEAKDVLDETRAVVSRAGFWWRLLATARVHRTAGFWSVAGVAALLLVGFVVLQSRLDVGIGWAAVLAEALTVGAALVAFARSTLARATPVFNRLDALQATIERRVEEARAADRAAHERARVEAEAREREARDAVTKAQAALDAASSEVDAAESALAESTSAARLGRFIRDRAASADYDQYLGLIAMIHRDFDQLSRLMAGRDGEAMPDDLPRVDRIVLYIDDLDRCYPPEKVVRVLEAVHLLLFFPLFVVFVGVDSRWVSRALTRYYDQMLGDELLEADLDDAPGGRAPADSQDFLEKIFQVPFWLHRMDPPAVQRLLHQLITPDQVGPAAGQRDGAATDGGDLAPGPDDDDLAPGSEDEELAPAPARARSMRGAALRTTLEAEASGTIIGEPAAPPAETLRISEAELAFMDEVAPLMPRTPRSVKRFVNIYRLYKAALSTAGLARFLGTRDQPGNFQAVQVLLSLVIGTPDFARAVVSVLDDLDSEEPHRLSELPGLLPVPHRGAWEPTLDALEEFAHGSNDLNLAALREVAPLVSRYSVHHMVSELPGESTLD